ncbi:MAG: thiosulfate oxidation carrier protein SoxY [Hyphomicrobiaceae bacterium]|nr:thiosulfate oxidation carrier protein SoxY [Hyphomicrobiaceae bacterium]
MLDAMISNPSFDLASAWHEDDSQKADACQGVDMGDTRVIAAICRRDVLIGAGAAAAVLGLAKVAGAADPSKATPQSPLEQALDKILGDAKPQPGKITVELPEIAENGNTVPYAIAIDSPMTEADHIKAVHVLASANPLPNVASFHFTPLSGRAYVSSRMRLAKTQEVVILAELSTAKFIVARRSVKVTIGGCGG